MSSIIDVLFNTLIKNKKVAYFNSDKSELMTRCCYCGDSAKNKNHAHLYISSVSPHSFFCQRCESTGILTDALLEDIDAYDDDLSILVYKNFKAFKKNTTVKDDPFGVFRPIEVKFPKYDLSGKFKPKLEYIEERLGHSFDRTHLRQFKIVNSLEDFLTLNGRDSLLSNDKVSKACYLVDKYGVGWVSQDGNYATFRYYTGDFKTRFKTICLNPYNIGSKIYTIQSRVDLLAPTIELIQTEGVFDLISVYMNFYKDKDNVNRVFSAINGKGFNLVPNTLRRMGFMDIKETVYSDNDVTLENYKYIFDLEKFNSMKIVYNDFEDEKDFGVCPDKIHAKHFKLK